MRRAASLLLLTLASIAMAADPPLARVAGEVRDDAGAPVPGFTVRLQSATMTHTAITDVEGRYAFAGVAQGDYEIFFELSGYGQAQRRLMVDGPSVSVPVEEIVPEEAIVLACGRACADDPPSTLFDQPLCSEYMLNDVLIEAAADGDASAIALLRSRYETAETYSERHRIAGALLRPSSGDAKFWKELVSHAETVLRFPHGGEESSPEYLEWCGERGVDPSKHWYMALHALDMASKDPRSRPLLRRALALKDDCLREIAIEGLGAQQDFESLPLIERAIRASEEKELLAGHLAHFADQRADAIAMKYLDGDLRESYLEWRSAMKESGGDPR